MSADFTGASNAKPIVFDFTKNATRPEDLSLICDCVGGCTVFTVVAPWDDGPEEHYLLDFHQHIGASGMRDRVRIAWQVLRGREPYVHGVVLYAEKAKRLRDFLVARVPS